MELAANDPQEELVRLRTENARLRNMLGIAVSEQTIPTPIPEAAAADSFCEPLPPVTVHSPTQEKIALFRALFRGRHDVYALFWINERTGKRGYAPACEDPWSSAKRKPKRYLPLTDQIIQEHLSSTKTIGLFPLLPDHTCWFLACDFDKEGWALDALAFLAVCRQHRVPAYLERSRSGNGGHVWIFFASPVTATSARQLGMRLLRETMVLRAEMDLASYDRFFPNQDFMPKGGFGNLIALPLQKACRVMGHTEFLNPDDPQLQPWPDQWAFLSQAQRLTPDHVKALLEMIPPVAVGPTTVGTVSEATRQRYPAPEQIRCTFGAGLSIEKSGLPPWLLSALKHLASLHNPLFYQRQKLRLSTFRIPRFIKCYDEDASHLHMPRGVLEEVNRLCKTAGSALVVTDVRPTFQPLSFTFSGQLTASQEPAVQAVLKYGFGVLVAPLGAGKTVMGCAVVAQRNVPTLILAHRKPILEQWRAQLMSLLNLSSSQIGQVGGGRHRQSGLVDLGMIQSLTRRDDLETFFSAYGLVIVDECHHLPAFTFEACLKHASVRSILGLTATPYRRDGLQEIITMQCGPIRSTIAERTSNLLRTLMVRETSFTYPSLDVPPAIQEVFRSLVHDEARTSLIVADVRRAVSEGRRCLILSQWREHCRLLAEALSSHRIMSFVLDGTLGKKQRTMLFQCIQATPPEEPLVVIATGSYLGEGFDCPQIDTLFLAFPIAFKGKLVQYVGRALRDAEGKTRVTVYDYADLHVPVLNHMHARRLKTYKVLGFAHEAQMGQEAMGPSLFPAERSVHERTA